VIYDKIFLVKRGEKMAYSEQMWQDAKKKCRLNNEDIALAKQKRKAKADDKTE
jgi:hypothetical protein